MTITTTRRSVRSLGRMTRQDSAAWWQAHGSEVGGTAGEFDGLATLGQMLHPVSGDGWGQLSGFMPVEVEVEDGVRTRISRSRSFTTRTLRDGTTVTRTRGDGRPYARITHRSELCDHLTLSHQQLEGEPTLPTVSFVGDQVWSFHPRQAQYWGPVTGTLTTPIDYHTEFLADLSRRPACGEGSVHYDVTVSRGRASWATTTVDAAMERMASQHGYIISMPEGRVLRQESTRARRIALSQMTHRGCLVQTTPLLGEDIPRTMWFDRSRGHYGEQHRRRDIHITDAFVVSSDSEQTSDELVPDTTQQELVSWSDLRQLLEMGGLTAREADALDRHAFGVAQPDRSARASYQRGAARARRILAGPIITTWPRLTRSYCWTEV